MIARDLDPQGPLRLARDQEGHDVGIAQVARRRQVHAQRRGRSRDVQRDVFAAHARARADRQIGLDDGAVGEVDGSRRDLEHVAGEKQRPALAHGGPPDERRPRTGPDDRQVEPHRQVGNVVIHEEVVPGREGDAKRHALEECPVGGFGGRRARLARALQDLAQDRERLAVGAAHDRDGAREPRVSIHELERDVGVDLGPESLERLKGHPVCLDGHASAARHQPLVCHVGGQAKRPPVGGPRHLECDDAVLRELHEPGEVADDETRLGEPELAVAQGDLAGDARIAPVA